MKFSHYLSKEENVRLLLKDEVYQTQSKKICRRLIRKHIDGKVDIPKKEPFDKVGAEGFVKLFQKMYETDDVEIQADKEKIREVPLFTMTELKHAVKNMKNRKSEDMSHIVAELIKHANDTFFRILLDYVQFDLDYR